MPIMPPKPEPINPMVALGLGKIKKKPTKPPPKQTLEEAIAALSGDKTEEEGGDLIININLIIIAFENRTEPIGEVQEEAWKAG